MKKVLRFVAILFMALTAGFTLMGGVGTSCVAFNPTGFGDSMAKLAPMQWLYVLFVLVTTAIGVAGIWATIQLVRGAEKAYRNALIVMLLGILVGVVHIAVSRSLRGSSMPVDGVVYTTVLTLVLFLVLRIPGIWQQVDFSQSKPGENNKLGGAVSIVLGGLCLTIQFLAGPTHTWGGVNYADAFHATLTVVGLGLLGLPVGRELLRRRSWHRAYSAVK
ncbi:MAG: hypothetical protein MUC85_04485 [Anaerolineales bacterium]|jgi:hypothetical protein|nr:hypothetical protein [Anaerolineales bacterium]